MIDFLYNLVMPRKSAGVIIRNKILDEVSNSIRIESMKTNIAMISSTEVNNDNLVGYNTAIYSVLNLIENLK